MNRIPIGLMVALLLALAGAAFLLIASARFARRRREAGAWDQRGPKDPSYDLSFSWRLDPRLGSGAAFDRFNRVRPDGFGEEEPSADGIGEKEPRPEAPDDDR